MVRRTSFSAPRTLSLPSASAIHGPLQLCRTHFTDYYRAPGLAGASVYAPASRPRRPRWLLLAPGGRRQLLLRHWHRQWHRGRPRHPGLLPRRWPRAASAALRAPSTEEQPWRSRPWNNRKTVLGKAFWERKDLPEELAALAPEYLALESNPVRRAPRESLHLHNARRAERFALWNTMRLRCNTLLDDWLRRDREARAVLRAEQKTLRSELRVAEKALRQRYWAYFDWRKAQLRRRNTEELLLGGGEGVPSSAPLASLTQCYLRFPWLRSSDQRGLRRSLRSQEIRPLRRWQRRNLLLAEKPSRRAPGDRRAPAVTSQLTVKLRQRLRRSAQLLALNTDLRPDDSLLSPERRRALGRKLSQLAAPGSCRDTLVPLLCQLVRLRGSHRHWNSAARLRQPLRERLKQQRQRNHLRPTLLENVPSLRWTTGALALKGGPRPRYRWWQNRRWRTLSTLTTPRRPFHRFSDRLLRTRSRLHALSRIQGLRSRSALVGFFQGRRRLSAKELLRHRPGNWLRSADALLGQGATLHHPLGTKTPAELEPNFSTALKGPAGATALGLLAQRCRRSTCTEVASLLTLGAQLPGYASLGRSTATLLQLRLRSEKQPWGESTAELPSAAGLERRSFTQLPRRSPSRGLLDRVHRQHCFRLSRLYPFRGHVQRNIRYFNMDMVRYRETVAEFSGFKIRRAPHRNLRIQDGSFFLRSQASALLPLLARRSLALQLQLNAPLGAAPELLSGRTHQRLQTLERRGSWSTHFYHGHPRVRENWKHYDRSPYNFLYRSGTREQFSRKTRLRHGRVDLRPLALASAGALGAAMARFNGLGNGRELLLSRRLARWMPRYCLQILLTPRRNNVFCTIMPLRTRNAPGERIFHLSAGQVCHRKGYLRRSPANRRELYGKAAFRLLRHAKKDRRFKFLVIRVKHYYDAVNRMGTNLGERLGRTRALFRRLLQFQNDYRYPVVALRLTAAYPSFGGKIGLSPRRKKRLRPAKVRAL